LQILKILSQRIPGKVGGHHEPRFFGKRVVVERNHHGTSIPRVSLGGFFQNERLSRPPAPGSFSEQQIPIISTVGTEKDSCKALIHKVIEYVIRR
jgi:hypothetical protein